MICKKKHATGNVEGKFSVVMKVGDFHHKKSGNIVPTCILDIGSADHFLMNAGHFHQKNL